MTIGTGLGIEEVVVPKRRELFRLLERHKARNPRVFGSIARREGSRTSDLDLIVDFDAGASITDQIGLIQDLEMLFHRRVDVAEPDGIHWLVRPQVLFEAIAI